MHAANEGRMPVEANVGSMVNAGAKEAIFRIGHVGTSAAKSFDPAFLDQCDQGLVSREDIGFPSRRELFCGWQSRARLQFSR